MIVFVFFDLYRNPCPLSSDRRARGEEFSALAAKCAGAYSLAAIHLAEEASPEPTPTTSKPPRGNGVGRAGSLKQHALTQTTDHPKRSVSIAAKDPYPTDLRTSVSCDFWYQYTCFVVISFYFNSFLFNLISFNLKFFFIAKKSQKSQKSPNYVA